MQSKAALSHSVRIGLATCLLATAGVTHAEQIEEDPSVGAMIADAVLVRPVYFLLSQAGAVLYTATLPFTLMSGDSDDVAESLVVTPLQYGFVRCLGCGKVGNRIDELDEGDGKTTSHYVQLSGGYTSVSNDVGSGTGFSGGVHIGTRWSLTDRSRFDLMLGARSLGEIETSASSQTFTDTMVSYQLISRFGREIARDTDLMFKIGLHNWALDREQTAPSAATGSTSGTDLLLGLGADYHLSPSFRAGLDFTAYSLSGEEGTNVDNTVRTFDLTATYTF
tara:strand:+ start:212 stop:1048 length:837 start_codon:yes stop_codon:yes gene_type:complete